MTAARLSQRAEEVAKTSVVRNAFLLPMPHETVRRISLEAHLALVGCTRGKAVSIN